MKIKAKKKFLMTGFLFRNYIQDIRAFLAILDVPHFSKKRVFDEVSSSSCTRIVC